MCVHLYTVYEFCGCAIPEKITWRCNDNRSNRECEGLPMVAHRYPGRCDCHEGQPNAIVYTPRPERQRQIEREERERENKNKEKGKESESGKEEVAMSVVGVGPVGVVTSGDGGDQLGGSSSRGRENEKVKVTTLATLPVFSSSTLTNEEEEQQQQQNVHPPLLPPRLLRRSSSSTRRSRQEEVTGSLGLGVVRSVYDDEASSYVWCNDGSGGTREEQQEEEREQQQVDNTSGEDDDDDDEEEEDDDDDEDEEVGPDMMIVSMDLLERIQEIMRTRDR